MQMRQTWRFECRCLLVIPCELSIVEHEVSRAENPFAILGYVRLDHLQSTVCLSTMITADAAESLRRALLLRTVDCANRFHRARKHTNPLRLSVPFVHCRCTLPLHTAAAHCRCTLPLQTLCKRTAHSGEYCSPPSIRTHAHRMTIGALSATDLAQPPAAQSPLRSHRRRKFDVHACDATQRYCGRTLWPHGIALPHRVPEVRGMRIRYIERQPRLKENIRATSCSAQLASPNRCRCGWGEPISFRSHPCRAAVH
jgi:hypothetical protein